MVLQENLSSNRRDKESSVEDSRLTSRPEWHSCSRAAVTQQRRLASLNERLARFFRLVFDVEVRRHRSQVSRRSKRASRVTEEHPHSRCRKSFCDESGYRSWKSQTPDSSHQSSDVVDELESTIGEESQNNRSLPLEREIRIDSLQRAVDSLSEENEELMRRNAELEVFKAEFHCEVQLLKYEKKKLEEKVDRMADHQSLRIVNSSLQQENHKLKARLDRQKQILRKGLDDFISRSSEALLNGTSLQIGYEEVVAYDSDDEMQNRGDVETRSDVLASSAQRDLAMREKVAQLEEHLESVTEELEHERFKSQRRINAIREILNRVQEDLTSKNNSLQRTNEELEAAFGVLRSFIQTGGGAQKEIEAYRCLLERAESQLYNVSDDSSADSSSASETSLRRRRNSKDSDRTRSFCSRSDVARKNSRCLEIETQDVRRGKFVVLTNNSDEPLDISRWYLVQQCGENKVTHRFPTPFIIKPRSRTIVWSANVKASHRSPVNYVMDKTVFPWCESGDVDLITKVYDRQGYQISKRETRIPPCPPVAAAAREAFKNSRTFLHDVESEACSIS